MRALTAAGPTADQDAITTVAEINNISITTTDRVGSCVVIGSIGYIDTDALGVVHTGRLLIDGVLIPGAIVLQETGAVDDIAGRINIVGFVENVPVGSVFTMDIASAGTGVDVKLENAQLTVVALPPDAGEVAGLVAS